jgi:hypothetical protein
MNPVIQTWNGNALQTSHFKAIIPQTTYTNLVASATYSPRVGDFPFQSASTWNNQVFPIKVAILDRGAGLLLQRNILKGYFSDGLQHQLVVYDAADSNRAWYLNAIVIAITEPDYATLTISLALADPIWRVVTPSTQAWSITATGQTQALTVLGNYKSKPVITYEPTSARTGGYSYKRWIPIYNPLALAHINLPLNVVGTVLDTATLVVAGKMLASGYDVALNVDGAPVDIWMQSFNTANTKIWYNASFSINSDVTLGAAIASSGAVSTITVPVSAANKAAMLRLANAANKILLIDSEAFSFTGVTGNSTSYSFTGCTRAQKNTSMATHSLSAPIHWIEHDIWLMYGNSAITAAPTPDNTKMPLISLTSTNTSWIWTVYSDWTAARSGRHTGEKTSGIGPLSMPYTGNQGLMANPSTEMGMMIMAYTKQNVWKAETAGLDWYLYHPAGFTNLVYSGSKYTWTTAWPELAAFQTSVDGKNWVTNLAEAAPPANTWTAFGPRNQAIPVTSRWIRFIFSGSVPAVANYMAAIQFDTVTATIASANVPQVTVGPELVNYNVTVTITNTTTGEWLSFAYPAFLNHTITVDCVNKVCYYDDRSVIPVTFSSVRADWMNLLGGQTNTLQVDDVGIANVTVNITWNDCQI